MSNSESAAVLAEEDQPVETSSTLKPFPHLKELYARGKSLREKCPRQSHAYWKESDHRPDPLSLIEQANHGRLPQLVPIRHGRMLQSPFTFFRGAALHMAADLANTPATGVRVQACGDCHLLNFGAFGTPERRVIFDINDLDETLPAPWEWDIKRLATSFVLACRNNGFSDDSARDAALCCVRSYRERTAEFSRMKMLDVWYSSIDVEDQIDSFKDEEDRERIRKRLAKARKQSSLEHDFPQLVTNAGLTPTIKENPPLIFHWQEVGHEEHKANIERAFTRYRASMREDLQLLLDRYKLMDVAIKVVGIGSVGTYCGILLLMASDKDPLFLQFKHARPSVLEAYAGKSHNANHGERVVHGCRMMQSASDMFLGWTEGDAGRHFYVRQLRDMKVKPMIDVFSRRFMCQYAEVCGWTLAQAHARSGESAIITGYLGDSDKFDLAIADFAIAYADQSERDFEVLRKAAHAGQLEVFVEPDLS